MPAGPEAVEAVSEILSRVGYNGIAVELPLRADDDTHLVKAYVVYDRAARPRVRRTKEALGHLQAFGLGPIGKVRLRAIADEDWLESWKASVTPLRVGAFLVRPTWHVDPQGARTADEAVSGRSAVPPGESHGAIVLALDPGMAFGTGLHPTTQQCLEALSTLTLAGRSLLDVGTGSGILAIAAAKRGAGPIVAVDSDELAVAAARENAARNGVAVDVRHGSAADVAGTFDAVVANLVGPALCQLASDLRARLRSGGTLVAAGIVGEAEAEVRDALRMSVVDRDQRGDWVRLTLSR